MRKMMTLLAAFALVLSAAVAAGAAQKVPDEVVIGAAAAKKAPVPFPHGEHVKQVKSCDVCHHTDKGLTAETAADVKPCSACHLNPTDETVPSMGQMSMTKNPFHKTCITCHKTEAKGPTKCDDCHKKS